MSILRIYFSAQWRDSTSPCPWALCEESGKVISQGLSQLDAMPAASERIGIVSFDRVLIFTAPRPPGSKRRWQGALPFIAEEHALSDPEDIHAVAVDEAGKISVLVVSKSWMRQITKMGLRRLIPETLMPDLPPDGWTLVWDGKEGFLRTSATTGLALDCGDSQTPPLALKQSLAVATPEQIQVRYLSSAQTGALPDWDLPLAMGPSWDWRCAPISSSIPNLLSGEFSPPLRLFDGLAKLGPALVIMLVALLIEIAGTHIEWIKLANEKQQLNQEMARIFHATFGDESELVDGPLQMRRNLVGLRHAAGVIDEADFISLLDRVSPLLGDAVRGLNYESGRLEIDVKLGKSEDLEKLKKDMNAIGLKVRSSGLQNLPDGLQARLTVEGMQ